MKSYILLENVRFFATHGVYEHENIEGNTFIVNIKIEKDISDAMATDDLDTTLNYGRVYEIIESEMKIQSKLLEHVAGRIIKSLRSEFISIGSIELKISKKNPPIEGEVEQASIIVID